MVSIRDTNADGGRYAATRISPEPELVWESSSKSNKRRKRKSAKGRLENGNGHGPTSQSLSSSGIASLAQPPPLRSINEAAVLRSNSAEPSSVDSISLEALLPVRQDRQSSEDILQHTARRPHQSLSFQDSRPISEGDRSRASHDSSTTYNLRWTSSNQLAACLQALSRQHYDSIPKVAHLQHIILVCKELLSNATVPHFAFCAQRGDTKLYVAQMLDLSPLLHTCKLSYILRQCTPLQMLYSGKPSEIECKHSQMLKYQVVAVPKNHEHMGIACCMVDSVLFLLQI